jgi:DNA-binding response OmpR family regulator
MVYDAHTEGNEGRRVATVLSGLGSAVDVFSDGPRFLEAAVTRPPDLVVYALGAALEADLGVLRLLRRARPDVGLIVLARETSLQTRAAIQPLRPTYYLVGPLDPAEVVEVAQAALRRRPRSGEAAPRPPASDVSETSDPEKVRREPSP